MKRWALITVVLYVAALVLLTFPVIYLASAQWWARNGMDAGEVLAGYRTWGYWLWIGFLAAGQAALLLVADDGLDAWFRFLTFTVAGPDGSPLTGNRPVGQASQDLQALMGVLNLTLVFWVLWALLFWRHARQDAAGSILQRCVRWLLRGSILELLIAVPSHIIVRRREDCCAPAMTLVGLITGLSVMLMCFGPGVFYLFVKRARSLQPRTGAKPA